MGEKRGGQGSAAGPYCWKPHPRTHQGQHRWAEIHIMRDHGALGELYPYRFRGNGFLEGGGTIPWLGYVNKGLYDINQPSWGGWTGRFKASKQKNVLSRHASVSKDEKTYGEFFAYTEATDSWTDPDEGTVYDNGFAPVWRWRSAQSDEQWKLQWPPRRPRGPHYQIELHANLPIPDAIVAGDPSHTESRDIRHQVR